MKNSQRQALMELAELLAPAEPSVASQVALACDDMPAYVRKYKKRLAERAITEPNEALSRVALIDALSAKKLIAEIDTSAAAEDVLHALNRLASVPKRRGRFRAIEARDDFEDMDALSALGAAQSVIDDKALAILDMQSDALPIVAIDPPAFVRLEALATQAGFARASRVAQGAAGSAPARTISREAIFAAAQATLIVPNPTWRMFIQTLGETTEVWGIKIAELAIEMSERTLGADRRHGETLSFSRWDETRAEAERRIAARTAQGFAEIPLAEFQRQQREAEARSTS